MYPSVPIGLRTVHSQLTPKPFQSFVLTETMSSPRAGNPLPYVQTFSLAVRNDGSWVKITPITNVAEETVNERAIYDMRTKIWTTVDELTKSTLTRQMTEHQISTLRAVPAASCGGKAAGTILGQNVEFVETEDDSGGPTNNSQEVGSDGAWMYTIATGNNHERKAWRCLDTHSGHNHPCSVTG